MFVCGGEPIPKWGLNMVEAAKNGNVTDQNAIVMTLTMGLFYQPQLGI